MSNSPLLGTPGSDAEPFTMSLVAAASDPVGELAAAADPDVPTHGYSEHKAAYLKRLRRIEGQVRGIHRMVDEDAYCIDILTQVAAATKALQAVALGLLDEHLGHCVVRAAQAGGDEADVKLAEASAAIARLVRS